LLSTPTFHQFIITNIRCAAKHERTRARRSGIESFQIAFLKPCHFEKVFEQADLQGLVSVDGDLQPDDVARLTVDVMAALNSEELPAVTLDEASKLLAGEGLHTAISSTLSLPVDSG
jgi:hypothetical protein